MSGQRLRRDGTQHETVSCSQQESHTKAVFEEVVGRCQRRMTTEINLAHKRAIIATKDRVNVALAHFDTRGKPANIEGIGSSKLLQVSCLAQVHLSKHNLHLV